MTENSNQEGSGVIIHLESTDYTVAPGSSIVIPIVLTNTGPAAGNFQMYVEDIPPNWVSTTSPVTHLDGGEEKQITLVIQPPGITETGPGNFPFTIRVVNQADASQVDKVEVSLVVAAYEVEGRIGVMMESTQYSASPGTGTIVQILLHNQGLADDEFRLSVEGIPVSWISTDSPVTKLVAGEQRKVKLTIIPPPASGSRAGRYTFKIQVISAQAPDQMAVIDCTLTVAAVASFSSELKPAEIRDGQVASLVVSNNGNLQGTYTISFESEEDTLVFDPSDPQQLQVPAGESAAVEYSTKPQKKQIIGSDLSYPFTAKVQSSDEEAQMLEGKMIGEALIPFWVVPVVLVLCLAVICVSFVVFVFRTQSAEGQATQTAAVYLTETAVEGGVLPTDTLEPGETPLPTEIPTEGPPPTGVPTESPLPSETPIPSETAIPTDTVVPTETPIVIPDVGRIAFQSNREGDPELYIQDTGTGAIGRLTTSLGVDTHPAYSPDGMRLAFMSDRTGNNEIYVANADGSNPINISNNPATDQSPSWSPDGQWIAFATNRDGNLEIYIMRPDGTDPQNLTNSPADDQIPSWFTNWIAFQSNRDGNQQIYLMNTDGSDQRNLSNNSFNDTTPYGAPNGTRLAFSTDRDGNLEVYSMGTDGSNQTNLTNNPSSADQSPAWSRDGNWIAFITDRDLNQEIYIMRDNGSEVYNVTNNPATDIVPAWQ